MDEDKRDREYNVSPIRAFDPCNTPDGWFATLRGRPCTHYARVAEFLPARIAVFSGPAPWQRPEGSAWVFVAEVKADERAYLGDTGTHE